MAWKALLCVCCIFVSATSCVEPLDYEKLSEELPGIDIWFLAPGAEESDEDITKAWTGTVAFENSENRIKEVLVWAYEHVDNEADGVDAIPVGYVEYTPIGANAGTTWTSWNNALKIRLIISTSFIQNTETPKVDLFLLVNWSSIFKDSARPSSTVTRGQLRSFVFGDNTKDSSRRFGANDKTCWVWIPNPSNPNKGGPNTTSIDLPMSCIYKGLNNSTSGIDLTFLKNAYDQNRLPSDTEFKNNVGVVKLKWAVSKMRFVFSKPVGMDNVKIARIVLDNGVIPKSSYVFEQGSSVSLPTDQYNGAAHLFKNSTLSSPLLPSKFNNKDLDIGESVDPEELATTWFKSEGKNHAAYESKLLDAIKNGEATEMITYFRETDRPIKGTIYYSIDNGQTEIAQPFSMEDIDGYTSNYKFGRGRLWSVFAYFRDDEMHFKLVNDYWSEAPHESQHTFK